MFIPPLPAYLGSDSCSPTPIDRSCKSHDTVKIARLTSMAPSVVETSEDLQPLSKHMRTEWPSKSLFAENESSAILVPVIIESCVPQDVQCQEYRHSDD